MAATPTTTEAPEPNEAEVLASFQQSLEDVLAVAEGLAKYCKTPEELIGLLKRGVKDPAQARMLLDRIKES